MWAKGSPLLILLLVAWEGRPGNPLPSGPTTPVQSNNDDSTRGKASDDVALLRQEVQQLSHLIAAFLAKTSTPAAKECRSPYVELRGRCLVVLDEITGSWAEMRAHCNNLGGELVQVDDANFMADLIQYITDHKFDAGRYWIGASDLGHEGNWRWPDGSPVRMGTPFWGDYGSSVQQPDTGIRERCVNIPRDDRFFFHNGPCDEINSGICEY